MILKTIPVINAMAHYEKIEKLAKEAFPPKEYLAPSVLVKMAQAPDFDFLALYDEEKFAGYIAVRRYKKMTYLFFLAIDTESRSHGYGRRAIETLKALYPNTQQVVDMEMLDESADNAEQREKRRNFYLSNGYKLTGHFLSYFGVDYEILCMDENFDFEMFKEMMTHLAVPGFSPKYFVEQGADLIK